MRPAHAMHTVKTTAIALAAAASLAVPHARAEATNPKSAAECRAISDFTLRGQCWDALDREKQQDEQVEKKKSFGLGLHAPSFSAIIPRKADRVREQQAEKEDVKKLTLTLADVQDTPQGRLLLTSTDGAVWEQTDGDAINNTLTPGDTIQVSKGFLGGYMCQVSRWQLVRCQRDR